MKTNFPIIKLFLRVNKTLADRTHPIMLRCSWKGRKEISTHFSCMPNQWDAKNERLKKNYPNAATVNQLIGKMKADAIERRDRLFATGGTVTPDAILGIGEEKTMNPTSLKTILENCVEERHLGLSSKKHYDHCLHVLQRFFAKEDVDINDITAERLRALMENERNRGRQDSSIMQLFNCLNAAFGYAYEKGIVTSNPLIGLKFRKLLQQKNDSVYIHHTTLKWIKGEVLFFLRKDNSLPLRTRDRFYPVYFYMLMVLLQGLAPMDIALLRKSQVEMKHIGNQWYYAIDTKRSKTGVPVKIRVPKDEYSDLMLQPLSQTKGDYLLPYVTQGMTEVQIHRIVYRELAWMNNRLKWWWQQFNKVIGDKYHTGEVQKIPDDATMYSARHSYAQCYMANGGQPLQLATLMGRSVEGLGVYVKQLSAESDLVQAVSTFTL